MNYKMYKLRKRISKGYYKVTAFLLKPFMKETNRESWSHKVQLWFEKRRRHKEFFKELYYYLDIPYCKGRVIIAMNKYHILDNGSDYEYFTDMRIRTWDDVPPKLLSSRWAKRNKLEVEGFSLVELLENESASLTSNEKEMLSDGVGFLVTRKS